MKNSLKIGSTRILTIFVVASSLMACGHGPVARPYKAMQFSPNNPVENALAGRGDLSIFYQALYNTGVVNELKKNKEYTFFAPTNAAFAEINPTIYPCFYNVQCRGQVAAVLRNHIIEGNDSIHDLSKRGSSPIPTIGNHAVLIEEAYKNDYTIDGEKILYESNGETINLTTIDSVLVTGQEMAQFRTRPAPPNIGSSSDTGESVTQTTTVIQTTTTQQGGK